jgi:hypothetical protein
MHRLPVSLRQRVNAAQTYKRVALCVFCRKDATNTLSANKAKIQLNYSGGFGEDCNICFMKARSREA